MYHIAIKLIVTALALILVSYLIPGIHVQSFYYALLVAFVLGILNVLVRPVLVFFTLPATILTLGLFIFVINAFIFLLADFLLEGFEVDGFIVALIGSLVVSVASTFAYRTLT